MFFITWVPLSNAAYGDCCQRRDDLVRETLVPDHIFFTVVSKMIMRFPTNVCTAFSCVYSSYLFPIVSFL